MIDDSILFLLTVECGKALAVVGGVPHPEYLKALPPPSFFYLHWESIKAQTTPLHLSDTFQAIEAA